MSPRTKQQFEDIRKSRKESLVNAALHLFAHKGIQSTSISDIANSAGVSKGLLYNYFKDKNELIREIIINGLTEMMAELNFNAQNDLTKESFVDLINKNFEMLKNQSNNIRLYIAVLTQPSVAEIVKDEIFKIFKPMIQNIAAYYLEKGVKDPLIYGLLIGAILDGISIDYMFFPEQYPLDEIRDLIIEKFV